MFVHRQADRCCPMYQRVVRVEMEQISVLAGGAHAQDVLQRLWACLVLRGKVFDLE
jgi:glycerol-3-phosphate dehydrogenase